MDQIDVVAVVGACVPERHGYAHRFADSTGRMLIPAERLARSHNPVHEAAALGPWAGSEMGAIAEFSSTVSVTEIISGLTGTGSVTRLTGIVCVVDAIHLLDDLAADDYVATGHDSLGRVTDCTARALLMVQQLEHASMIVLVSWEALSTPNLSTVMALVSHLSPSARLQLQRDDFTPIPEGLIFEAEQRRAGWMSILNGEADPHMTDSRVSGFRYEQLRPLHPGRLKELLDARIEQREFGHIVRSAGFCRLATRSNATLTWDHVGLTIAFHLAAIDGGWRSGTELLAVGQDLAFIGLDLDRAAIAQAFDDAALTDEELAAGPQAWAAFEDPFPTWSPTHDLPS